MTSHSEASAHQVLADTGALVVVEDGGRVIVFDRGTGAPTTGAFALGVLAVVVGGFGLTLLITGSEALAPWAAVVLLAVGAALAAAVAVLVRTVRRRRARPLAECRSVAVLDHKRGLFSVAGGGLIQLDQVRFARRMQLTSSAPKLVASFPGGSKVLKRGSPFDGGIGRVDEVLNAAVQRR